MAKVTVFEGAKFLQEDVVFTVVKRSGLNVTLKNEETGEVLKSMKYSKLVKFWTAL